MQAANGMQDEIRESILGLGADVCGFASSERFGEFPEGYAPTDIYRDCKSVIAFGMALPAGLLDVNPRLVYAHFNGDIICRLVDEISFCAARLIEDNYKISAVPVPCDAPNEYWDAENLTAKGLISMKHTAVLCGLGQLGKSTLLLNPKYGNRLTIGAILLNVKLRSDEMSENICIPGCNKCAEGCPAHAIADGCVNQKLCRPNTYGLTARGFQTVDCNVCRSVCPMRNGR